MGVSTRSLLCPPQSPNCNIKAGTKDKIMRPTKTNNSSNATLQPRLFCIFLFVITATSLWSLPAAVCGQIYVTNAFANTIGKYGVDGTTVSDSLVTGLDFPFDIAVW